MYAQYSLGMYYKNYSRAKDAKTKAKEWLEKAAEQGCELAKEELKKQKESLENIGNIFS